jgi:hypothetical protein
MVAPSYQLAAGFFVSSVDIVQASGRWFFGFAADPETPTETEDWRPCSFCLKEGSVSKWWIS